MSGVARPCSIAAAAVMTLPVDPGSKTSSSERLWRSASGVAPGSAGSIDPDSAIASTSPVFVMTVTATQSAPVFSACAFAASCA